MNIALGQQYGPLQPNFSIEMPQEGYTCLTGPNNSGKSSILQLIFRMLQVDGSYGASKCVLLLPDRGYVAATAESGGRVLESFNGELYNQLNSTPLRFDQQYGPQRFELPRLLLGHTDYIGQVSRLNQYLTQLGLPTLVLAGPQQLNFQQVPVWFQGAGLRSLLAILAALTDPALSAICIDEPELGLEPKVQRSLRDLLIHESSERAIVVATHSHLFLDRGNPTSTRVVEREGNLVSVGAVGSEAQLHDIVFQLLGNDTSDLFFPGTYLVVEGAADQVLCEMALTTLDVPRGRVKVLAAGGMSKVIGTISAVMTSLVPLVVNDSPYASRVVTLIDQPSGSNVALANRLSETLGDRLYVLDETSIEQAVPDEWYLSANRDKAADLNSLVQLKQSGRIEELRQLKRSISSQLSSVMTVELLETVPRLRDAVVRAAVLGSPG